MKLSAGRFLRLGNEVIFNDFYLRYQEEDVEMTEDALQLLTKMAMETTLRYAIHMISTASLVAAKRKATEVEVSDIMRVYDLFVDLKRSEAYLRQHQEEFLFNDQTMSNE